MILYHGSNIKVTTPNLSKSKPFKDFGQGFYFHQAERMAEQRTLIMQSGEPTVSQFQFDETIMIGNELRVLTFDDHCEEWAVFVLRNRDANLTQPVHGFDIVYGPIADDGVTFQLRRYKARSISLQELVKELRFARGITFQYYFGTARALQHLVAL